MDSNIGRNLIKIVDSIPVLDAQTFDTLMTNQMNVIFFYYVYEFNRLAHLGLSFILSIFINKGFAHGFVFIKFSKSSIDSQREIGNFIEILKSKFKKIPNYFFSKFLCVYLYLMLQVINQILFVYFSF